MCLQVCVSVSQNQWACVHACASAEAEGTKPLCHSRGPQGSEAQACSRRALSGKDRLAHPRALPLPSPALLSDSSFRP